MLKGFFKSFGYAIKGVVVSLREQRNLKIQTFIALITIGAGFYVKITSLEWCIILLTIGLVIGLEMINTSIENLVDLVTRERTPHAGKIKDMAAGAVLFASLIAVAVGIIIFGKYFFA